MNEHGLCITTSAGVINPNYNEEGFLFPVVVRAILNNCKTVKEAIELLDFMEIADYRLIDRYGEVK
jgi:predicted choloylglycine hydrolase